MTNVIATQATVIDAGILDIARGALVGSVSSTGEFIENYSSAISSVFDRKDINGKVIAKWFNLSGKDYKGVKAECIKFRNAMMDKDAKFIKSINADGTRVHTATLDTYWQRVKIASGDVPSGKVSGTVDVDAKTAAELKTIINRILKSEEDGAECHASTILETLKGAYFVLTGEAHNADK